MTASLPPDHQQSSIQWHSPNEVQRSFYKPGMPFRMAVSLVIIGAFLLVSLIIVWFSVLAGILLFICAGIAIVIELSTDGR